MPGDSIPKAIETHNVHKAFPVLEPGDTWKIFTDRTLGHFVEAVRGVSLDVPRGTFLGILGRNGAGKSTMLRLLGKVYTPTRGDICLLGECTGLFELGGMGSTELTGRQYADRILRLISQGAPPEESDLAEIQDFSELQEYFDRPLRTYSSGMRARLYFSLATHRTYPIYLIDETLAVGDEHFQRKCWKRIRERIGHGASGVLVTHDWSAVLKLCQEACVMAKGTVISRGPTEDIIREYLDLRPPAEPSAQFCKVGDVIYARSQEELKISVGISRVTRQPLSLAYSIEMLRYGYGWEILLLGEGMEIQAHEDQVTLHIPQIPLPQGTYYFNLFLNQQDGTPCDARSWTHGNPIQLKVEGPQTSAVLLASPQIRQVEVQQ